MVQHNCVCFHDRYGLGAAIHSSYLVLQFDARKNRPCFVWNGYTGDRLEHGERRTWDGNLDMRLSDIAIQADGNGQVSSKKTAMKDLKIRCDP